MQLAKTASRELSLPDVCEVCSSANAAQKHFGAISCKACASFFRRFVNSEKKLQACSCGSCRSCRMQKCLAAGMNKCAVQFPKNADLTKTQFLQSVNLPMNFQSGDSDRILQLQSVYNSLQDKRKDFQELLRMPRRTTIRTVTSEWSSDLRIMWKICVKAFPEFESLPHSETNKLLCNFYPKWFGFTSVVTIINSGPEFRPYTAPPIDLFYEPDAPSLLSNTAGLKSVFAPYWKSYISNVLKPIFNMNLDEVEVIAIMALLFMDPGYSNLSGNIRDMCWNFSKAIKMQLSNYYKQSDKPAERILEVMNALLIVERFDKNIHEELQLCVLYGITIDEDCLQILNTPKL